MSNNDHPRKFHYESLLLWVCIPRVWHLNWNSWTNQENDWIIVLYELLLSWKSINRIWSFEDLWSGSKGLILIKFVWLFSILFCCNLRKNISLFLQVEWIFKNFILEISCLWPQVTNDNNLTKLNFYFDMFDILFMWLFFHQKSFKVFLVYLVFLHTVKLYLELYW